MWYPKAAADFKTFSLAKTSNLGVNPHARLTGAPKGRADAYGAPAETSKSKAKPMRDRAS